MTEQRCHTRRSMPPRTETDPELARLQADCLCLRDLRLAALDRLHAYEEQERLAAQKYYQAQVDAMHVNLSQCEPCEVV